MIDFDKNRHLWNKVVYGSPSESLQAANELNQLGEMGDKTYDALLFLHLVTDLEEKKTKRRKQK